MGLFIVSPPPAEAAAGVAAGGVDAFADVEVVNADFHAMTAKMQAASAQLAALKPTRTRTEGEINEARKRG